MADANNHIYFVWRNGSYQVMLATPTQPSYDPIPAYFYVTTPDLTAFLDMTKTTEDGKICLAGNLAFTPIVDVPI